MPDSKVADLAEQIVCVEEGVEFNLTGMWFVYFSERALYPILVLQHLNQYIDVIITNVGHVV